MAGDVETPFPQERTGARAGLAEPDVARVLAIAAEGIREPGTGQLDERRQEIDAPHDRVLLDAPRRHMSGPADDEGDADAPFIKTALAAAKWPGTADAAMSGVEDEDVLGPVVAGKDDDGLVR